MGLPLRIMTPPKLSCPLRWLVPVVTTAAVSLVQFAVLPRPSLAPFVLFFFGVGLTSWLAGAGPGVVSVALSAAVVNYCFLEPYFSWGTSGSDLRATGLFLVSAYSVAWFAGSLRQTAGRLEQVNRRKDEFLAVLSHELRNPLTPIRNSLYILGRAPCGSAQETRAKEVIKRQVEHMARLVDDLLDVSRMLHGRIQLRTEELDVGALVCDAIEDHRSMFERAGVELEVSVDPRPVWVQGDRARLMQVISSLLANAAKFTPKDGKTSVLVAVASGEREVVVRIADSGIGIASEVLAHLFEPFTQADHTLARSSGGLGLGLSTARGIVELHGGTIAARNRADGHGAELTVRMPVSRVSPPQETSSDEHRMRRFTRRILIIEDNVDSADSLREVLELNGFVADVAYTGLEGLEKTRTFKPDLVLCDIGLPGMDGYAVARAIRADPLLQTTYLVALSGYALHEDTEQSTDAGFDQHIAKPPSLETLERALAHAS